MTISTPLIRRSAAVVFAGALLLTACSGSSSDDAKKDTTTTAGEKTSTTASEAGGVPTTEELEAILPAADELGEGWVVDDAEPGPVTAIETATKASCPAAAALLAPEEEGDVTRAFTGPDAETVQISLFADVEPIDEATGVTAAEIVASINACEAVTAEEAGLTYTANFQADLNDDYGDGGVQIAVALNIADGTDTIDGNRYTVVFVTGTVGVSISGSDGVADDGTMTPIDQAGLDAMATELASRAEEL